MLNPNWPWIVQKMGQKAGRSQGWECFLLYSKVVRLQFTTHPSTLRLWGPFDEFYSVFKNQRISCIAYNVG